MRVLLFALLTALPATAQTVPDLIAAARAQVGVTVLYDPSYQSLGFPGGDVAPDRGVCTDVVIRALRSGWGIDLQLAVHHDMQAHFAAYPALWGLSRTDRNIDHRRVPNLQTLFTRAGAAQAVSAQPEDYLPGDVVTWLLPGDLAHIGIVSDQRSSDGLRPLVLHNIGAGAQEEDRLFDFPITGHYRIDPKAAEWLRAQRG